LGYASGFIGEFPKETPTTYQRYTNIIPIKQYRNRNKALGNLDEPQENNILSAAFMPKFQSSLEDPACFLYFSPSNLSI
jgi:hypothetical protein